MYNDVVLSGNTNSICDLVLTIADGVPANQYEIAYDTTAEDPQFSFVRYKDDTPAPSY